MGKMLDMELRKGIGEILRESDHPRFLRRTMVDTDDGMAAIFSTLEIFPIPIAIITRYREIAPKSLKFCGITITSRADANMRNYLRAISDDVHGRLSQRCGA